MNAIINSPAGTGGTLPGYRTIILDEGSTRKINLVAKTNWPKTARLSVALYGVAVPATLGEVLH